MSIKRRFVDLPHGQLHLRTAGDNGAGGAGKRPLLLLHASPGSAAQMEPMIADFAATRLVVSPDTPGNGDSVPLGGEPAIVDYARAQLQLLDALGLHEVDVYGTHTGAAIAVEMALMAPARVHRLVLDGVGLFTPAQQAELLANYTPAFDADLDGAYLPRIFSFCRDMFLFYPWYDRTPRGRRAGGLPPAEVLNGLVLEVLKAKSSYPLAYRAAMTWPGRERLPLLARPALITSSADDPLLEDSRTSLGLTPGATWLDLPGWGDPAFGELRKSGMLAFLDS